MEAAKLEFLDKYFPLVEPHDMPGLKERYNATVKFDRLAWFSKLCAELGNKLRVSTNKQTLTGVGGAVELMLYIGTDYFEPKYGNEVFAAHPGGSPDKWRQAYYVRPAPPTRVAANLTALKTKALNTPEHIRKAACGCPYEMRCIKCVYETFDSE